MSSWAGSLWGGESLVSANCQYLLAMESSGNLALYGLANEYEDPCLDGAAAGCRRRRRLVDNEWLFGWSTGTELSSNASLAEFRVDSDGILSVWEYPDVSTVDSASGILLWSVSTGVTGDTISRPLTFTLSNVGCLWLGTGWTLCSTYSTDPNGFTVSGSALQTLYPDQGAMVSATTDDTPWWASWWPLVGVVAAACFICALCVFIRKWPASTKRSRPNDHQIYDDLAKPPEGTESQVVANDGAAIEHPFRAMPYIE